MVDNGPDETGISSVNTWDRALGGVATKFTVGLSGDVLSFGKAFFKPGADRTVLRVEARAEAHRDRYLTTGARGRNEPSVSAQRIVERQKAEPLDMSDC